MSNKFGQGFWLEIFGAGLAAVDPERCLPPTLPAAKKYNKIIVLSVGKAAASMAVAALQHYQGADISGLVVCPEGYALPCTPLKVVEAGHPLPNENSLVAAEEALAAAQQAAPGDLVLLLVSGGASALLSAPVEGFSLGEKINLTNDLLRSGASISEINLVRKALSRIKGGKLLAAVSHGVSVCVRLISDVVGDDPRVIGSGLGYLDDIASETAAEVLERYGIGFDKSLLKQYIGPECRPETDLEVIANSSQMLTGVRGARQTASQHSSHRFTNFSNSTHKTSTGALRAAILKSV